MSLLMLTLLVTQASSAGEALTERRIAEACSPSNAFLSRGTSRCNPAAVVKTCERLKASPTEKPDAACLEALVVATSCMDICDAKDAGKKNEQNFCNCPGVSVAKLDDATAKAVSFNLLASLKAGAAAPMAFTAGWEAIAINGLTQFFVARAEDEIVRFAQGRLGKDLCDAQAPARVLLPSACGVLKPANETFAGQTFATLPSAVRSDVELLPTRLVTVVADEMSKAGTTMKVDRDFLCALETGLLLVSNQRAGLGSITRIDALFSEVRPADCADPAWKRVAAVWTRLSPFVNDAIAATEKRGTIPDDLAERLFTTLNGGSAPATDEERRVAKAFLGPFTEFLRFRLAIDKRSDDALTREAITAQSRMLGALFTSLGQTELARQTITQLWEALDAFTRQDYSDALLRLFALSAFNDMIEALPDQKLKELVRRIQKHLPLLTALAQARSSDDVQKALQAAAAPATSWREYRRRPGAGFISAILGVTAALEVPFTGKFATGGSVGPALPIGVEIGWRLNGDSSFNILFAIIDVGTLASTRIESGATGTESGPDGKAVVSAELSFASVLSPGIWLGFGIADSPFIITIGASLPPANRRYFACTGTAPCADTTTAPVFRASALLGIDLPAFPIF